MNPQWMRYCGIQRGYPSRIINTLYNICASCKVSCECIFRRGGCWELQLMQDNNDWCHNRNLSFNFSCIARVYFTDEMMHQWLKSIGFKQFPLKWSVKIALNGHRIRWVDAIKASMLEQESQKVITTIPPLIQNNCFISFPGIVLCQVYWDE